MEKLQMYFVANISIYREANDDDGQRQTAATALAAEMFYEFCFGICYFVNDKCYFP